MKPVHQIATLTLLAMVVCQPAVSQTAGTLSDAVLSGYGNITWQATADETRTNDFSVGFSPVMLYSMGENFLFEAELEFGVSGEVTTTSLEYAQFNYLGFDNVVITAGKFLVPFGLFGERVHPAWINKLPTAPALFGHAHGGVAEGGALLPILSDVGLMARYRNSFSSGWGLNLTAWVSQGPRWVGDPGGTPVDDGHEDDEGDDHSAASKIGDLSDEGHGGELTIEIPSVGFGVAFPDNNANKMLGARLGLVKGPMFEAYVGAFHARYDNNQDLDLIGSHLSMEMRHSGFEVRAEGMLLWQDVPHESAIEVLNREGYYVQASRRIGAWEPVVQWSHVMEAELEGQTASPDQREFAVGAVYWLQPSIPLKVAYHSDLNGDDHVFLQWAYGF